MTIIDGLAELSHLITEPGPVSGGVMGYLGLLAIWLYLGE